MLLFVMRGAGYFRQFPQLPAYCNLKPYYEMEKKLREKVYFYGKQAY
jgi:hypothetical protein